MSIRYFSDRAIILVVIVDYYGIALIYFSSIKFLTALDFFIYAKYQSS